MAKTTRQLLEERVENARRKQAQVPAAKNEREAGWQRTWTAAGATPPPLADKPAKVSAARQRLLERRRQDLANAQPTFRTPGGDAVQVQGQVRSDSPPPAVAGVGARFQEDQRMRQEVSRAQGTMIDKYLSGLNPQQQAAALQALAQDPRLSDALEYSSAAMSMRTGVLPAGPNTAKQEYAEWKAQFDERIASQTGDRQLRELRGKVLSFDPEAYGITNQRQIAKVKSIQAAVESNKVDPAKAWEDIDAIADAYISDTISPRERERMEAEANEAAMREEQAAEAVAAKRDRAVGEIKLLRDAETDLLKEIGRLQKQVEIFDAVDPIHKRAREKIEEANEKLDTIRDQLAHRRDWVLNQPDQQSPEQEQPAGRTRPPIQMPTPEEYNAAPWFHDDSKFSGALPGQGDDVVDLPEREEPDGQLVADRELKEKVLGAEPMPKDPSKMEVGVVYVAPNGRRFRYLGEGKAEELD